MHHKRHEAPKKHSNPNFFPPNQEELNHHNPPKPLPTPPQPTKTPPHLPRRNPPNKQSQTNQPRTPSNTLKANPPTPAKIPLEILDILSNNNQAQTAQLLYQGYTCEEIGKLLGFKSKAKASHLIQKIRQNKAF